jgi:hypothetical protein
LEDEFPMVIRSKLPQAVGASVAPAQKPALDAYHPGDAIPVPEVIEKDSDSVWALWSDAIEGRVGRDDEIHPATLLMGLQELPGDRDT